MTTEQNEAFIICDAKSIGRGDAASFSLSRNCENGESRPFPIVVVRTHADGRKSLYISGNVAYYVCGMPLEEGKRLHAWLLDWVTQDRFVYAHRWSVGDVVLWDNRPTLHRVLPYDPSHRRVLQRTELKGAEIPQA